MNVPGLLILSVVVAFAAGPAMAQFTVLDQAQDDAGGSAIASDAAARSEGSASACGARPFAIARMSWPSATLLAEIHARVLRRGFDCEVQLTPGDPTATISSMAASGQPAMAPEMWVNRIADVWNGAVEAQSVRSAAPSFSESQFEGWYLPSYMLVGPEKPSIAGLAESLPLVNGGEAIRLISCPIDWACSIINRNLVKAHGLENLVEIVEPANRFEMDRLIAEAVNRREPFLFYYWQPNAVLAQLDFAALDMGAYDEAAARCLADRLCADPRPSAFPPDLVVIALAERVFVEMPVIAGYFQRASLPLAQMDELLGELNVPGATPEEVADRFIADHEAIWRVWVGSTVP